MPREFKLFLVGMTIFALGNSSDSFLILRSQGLGLSLVAVISAYILYNLVYSLASTPAGRLADRIGARKVLVIGLAIFALVYAGFAFNTNPLLVWALFGIYGFYIAFTDGISKAMIGSLTTQDKAGTAYGTFYTITSLATLRSSISR